MWTRHHDSNMFVSWCARAYWFVCENQQMDTITRSFATFLAKVDRVLSWTFWLELVTMGMLYLFFVLSWRKMISYLTSQSAFPTHFNISATEVYNVDHLLSLISTISDKQKEKLESLVVDVSYMSIELDRKIKMDAISNIVKFCGECVNLR